MGQKVSTVPCRLSYRNRSSNRLYIAEDLTNIASIVIRMKWVANIYKTFKESPSSSPYHVRELHFILNPDGTIQDGGKRVKPAVYISPAQEYPARYRLPKVLNCLATPTNETVERRELFALGGLFYHILSGKKLLDGLSGDEKIQARFVAGRFPEDVYGLPMARTILGCWSLEFGEHESRFLVDGESDSYDACSGSENCDALLNGIIKIGVGAALSALAAPVVIPAILGILGFSALGPVAGGVAAGWQSGIGLVQAGSLFAWCQSVAMGGTAILGTFTTSMGFGGAIAAAIASAMKGEREDPDHLKQEFLKTWMSVKESG